MAKTYKVIKDHAELAEYKTLAAAKKLADKEHGEVFCDDQKVYPTEQDGSVDILGGAVDDPAASTVAESSEETLEVGEQYELDVDASEPGSAHDEAPECLDVAGRYCLNSLMNVRLKPSLTADVIGLARPGTVVEVSGIQNDWLAVKNGTGTVYILYGKGHFATKL
jgi:hypothetical protein